MNNEIVKFNYYNMVCEVTHEFCRYYLIDITNVDSNDKISARLSMDGIKLEDNCWYIQTKYGWVKVTDKDVIFILEDITTDYYLHRNDPNEKVY